MSMFKCFTFMASHQGAKNTKSATQFITGISSKDTQVFDLTYF
jgi:hypothetical protein